MTPFLRRIEAGWTVVDVGANAGSWTVGMADAVGPRGRVLAVEPDSRAMRALMQSCQGRPQVTCIHAAAGSKAGHGTLYLAPNSTQSSLCEANTKGKSPSVGPPVSDVPVITLDDLQAAHGDIRAVKIDAQGLEGDIFAGASSLLRGPVVWCIEWWPNGLKAAGCDPKDLTERLAGYGLHVVASGKDLSGPPQTWDAVAKMWWCGGGHTNLLLSREAEG